MAGRVSKQLLSAVVLLLCGMMMMMMMKGREVEAKICPQFCYQVDYVTCGQYGERSNSTFCNCCLAPSTNSNCTLHLKGGTTIHCH